MGDKKNKNTSARNGRTGRRKEKWGKKRKRTQGENKNDEQDKQRGLTTEMRRSKTAMDGRKASRAQDKDEKAGSDRRSSLFAVFVMFGGFAAMARWCDGRGVEAVELQTKREEAQTQTSRETYTTALLDICRGLSVVTLVCLSGRLLYFFLTLLCCA